MLNLFRKRAHDARVVPAGTTLTVAGGQKLLDAALAAGLDWPHDCRVGSCGTCRCTLRTGHIKPLTDFVYTLSPEEIAAGVILACQSRLKSDIEVEVALGAGVAAVETVGGHISAQRALTHDIVELSVTLDHDAFEAARAGQYLDVVLPGEPLPRSYSLAHAPTGGAQVSFFIRHVPGGAFTDWLFADTRTGATLTLSGPYGNFYQRGGSGRMICVAGGSGLAPINALLEAGAAAGLARECVVLFGARSQTDLYLLDELAALGSRWNAPFTLLPVLSDEPADSAWDGARGLVTEHLAAVARANAFAPGDEAYLCGPPAMVDAGVAALGALGLAATAIYFDRFLDASSQPGGRAALTTPP